MSGYGNIDRFYLYISRADGWADESESYYYRTGWDLHFRGWLGSTSEVGLVLLPGLAIPGIWKDWRTGKTGKDWVGTERACPLKGIALPLSQKVSNEILLMCKVKPY